jgi:uncharacterized protein
MIFYFHGLGATGDSPKKQALRNHFKNQVYIPELSMYPDEIEKMIDAFACNMQNYPLIFVGTSLGGFWANYAAQKYNAPCVLANPANLPYDMMIKHFRRIKHIAGVDVNKFDINIIAEGYKKREKWLSNNTNGKLVSLFLSKNDKILNYKITLSTFPVTSKTIIVPDGGHGFQKHWDLIIREVVNLINRRLYDGN